MISAKAIYQEIRDNDVTYRLFCSIAAKGEHQGGWENERIAALTTDRELAGKIERHGVDEEKHGRLFSALLRKRGLERVDVPAEADYCVLLERAGIGLSHERLTQDQPLTDEELLAYLVHSRVTEQRASEEVNLQHQVFADDPELGKPLAMIAEDEENHLAYCHEELLRLAADGHQRKIERMLRDYAQTEVTVYRDVSLAVTRAMGRALRWPLWKRALLAFGIYAVWTIEKLFTWRRMVRLVPPTRKNAMAPVGSAS